MGMSLIVNCSELLYLDSSFIFWFELHQGGLALNFSYCDNLALMVEAVLVSKAVELEA